MMKTGFLDPDQKTFSQEELRAKGISPYQVRKLVEEGKLIKRNKRY